MGADYVVTLSWSCVGVLWVCMCVWGVISMIKGKSLIGMT